jgi:hypothetical protein
MQPSKKRCIHDEDSYSSPDNPAILQSTFTCKQTSTNSTQHTTSECASSDSTSRHTTIHHVECSGVGRYHDHHERSADYFDVPFLPIHSSRMTGLRGQHRLADLESYIEEQANLSFVVYMTYDCVAYHEDNKTSFKRLSIPHLDEAIAYQAKPYFYVLQKDAEPAIPRSERLLPSDSLQKAFELLREAREKISGMAERQEDELPSNLVYP